LCFFSPLGFGFAQLPITIVVVNIPCRAVLLDMDGVLVDSTPAVTRVWTTWAEKHGLLPEDVVRQAHGRPSLSTIQELLPHGDHEAENLYMERGEIADVADVVALPGAAELLCSLPEHRRAVVTSASRSLAEVRLHAAGLPIPKYLVTASDIQRGKPDPEPYLQGARILGVPPAECVVIEDAPAGTVAGKAAGARVIALRTTTPDIDLSQAGADWIVDNCSAISLETAPRQDGLVLVLRGQR